MRISDWSSDVCSSDLTGTASFGVGRATRRYRSTESSERDLVVVFGKSALAEKVPFDKAKREEMPEKFLPYSRHVNEHVVALDNGDLMLMLELYGRPFETSDVRALNDWHTRLTGVRSEEHTSELPSIMHSPSAVFRLKIKKSYTYFSSQNNN